MKIAKADVFVHSPGRNFVTLKITTDDGLVGYGDATVNGRELAVASYLRDHLAPMLIGGPKTSIKQLDVATMSEAQQLEFIQVEKLGKDLFIRALPREK